MSLKPVSAKKSLRLVVVIALIVIVSATGLAAGWDTVAAFASDLTGSAHAALFGQANETKSELPGDTAPAFVIGTCDTAGPVEVEGTIAGTTPTAYATLAAAFTAINAGTHTGAVTVEICGDTSEGAATATLNASGTGAASYTTVAINPVGGVARTITGATTAGSPLIDFSGADNVTINGLNTGGNALTISNTTASATSGTATIRFIGGATNNTITNSTILGSNSASVATNGAVIFFSTDVVTANGNDNNTISNNNIGPAGANLPSKAFLCNGSTGTQAIGNSGLLIDNNNIFDFFGAAVTSAGVAVNAGCNTFSITNNRFYQTSTRTWTTGSLHTPILMNSSSATSGVQGMTITGNTIGYASNTQTGTYSLTGSTGSFQGIRFIGISGGTISNINSNTIASVSLTGVTSSGTSSSSPFTGIHVGGTGFAGNANVNNNTIGSQSAAGSLTFSTTTTTSTDVYGIYNVASDAWTSNGNNIGGISVTNAGASGTFLVYATRANTGSTTTWIANNNNIGGTVANSIQLNATGTSSQVIGMGATTAPSSFTGNTIRNLTTNIGTGTSSSASVVGILVSTSTPNHTLAQNTIFNLTNTNATAASVVTGIQFTGGTANIVERNLIYGLTAATTSASAEISGIRVAGGTTTYRNNMIALGAGVANALGGVASNSSTTGINGFNGALGTDAFIQNSVYIGGSPTAGTGASYALNGTQTSNTRSFRDNIFFNARSNSGATGKNYAVKINGTTANPSGLTINNNIYFANGSGGVFGFFNSADVANIGAWRTAVGQDANSFESNPQFNDPTNATPDLHLHPTNQTVAEANGVDVGVTNDFDGQTRSGLTPVDIGADAGNFVGLDLAPPAISYTPLSNTTLTGDRILSAITIADATGVASGGVLPRIYYKKGAGAYFSNACVLTSGTATNGQYSCTIIAANMGGLVLTDVVSYFVIAQDTLGNVSSNPSSGLVAANVNTVTTAPTSPNTFTILGSISGTKTVCASGCDYPTLTGASGVFNAINTNVATANINIQIGGDLTAEDGAVALNSITEEPAGSNFTVKIYPTGGTRAISGTNTGGLIRINAADRVTIDGSIGGTGTDRSLTITQTNTGTSSAVVWLQSNASDGATSNTIKNLNIVGNANTTTLFGIGSGSSTIATTSTGIGNNNNTIQNNNIGKVQYGIYTQGSSAAAKNNGNVITQNLMNGVSPNNPGKGGILVGFENSLTISQNTVDNITNTVDDCAICLGLGTSFSGTSTTGNDVTNAIVTRNIVGTLANTGTNTAFGIGVAGVTTGTNLIANNVITGVTANSTSPDTGVGIFIGGAVGSTTQVYHNSVSMTGDRGTGTSMPGFALAISGSVPTVDLKNNILFNSQTTTSTGKSYSIGLAYTSTLGNYANLTSNYNDLFGSGSLYNVGLTGGISASGTDRATLSAWQTETGKDANSLSVNPQFNSTTNLQPQTGAPVLAAGTPVSVTTDILGTVRSATTPTIGAYETGVDTAGPTITYTTLAGTTSTADRTVAISLADPSGFPTTGTGRPVIYYRKGTSGAFTASPCTFTSGSNFDCVISYGALGGAAPGDTIQYYFAAQDNILNVSVNPSAGATGLTANPPAAATAPTTPNSYQILVSIFGSKTVGAGGDYPTLTAAIAAVNAALITGPVTLSLTDPNYSTNETFPLTINANAGSSSTNTVTIKPATGVAPVITGSNATCIVALSGADWVVVDGSNVVGGTSKDLTISNTSTSGGTVCYTNSATNNTLKNSVVTGVTTSTTNGVVFMSTTATGTVGNNNNTIENNDLRGGTTAPAFIFFNSGTATAKNTANVITQNRIFNFSNTGIRDDFNSVGAKYSRNEIFEATTQTTALTGFRPSDTSIDGFTFTRNYIHDLNTSSTGNVYGLHLFDTSTVATSEVSNNMISLSPTAPLNLRGIYDQTAVGEKYSVFFNSVYLGGVVTGASTSEAYYWSIASTTNARNNILVNARTGGTGKHYAIRFNTTLANIVSDYNDIYATGGTANVFGNDGTADRADLAAWKAATSKDASSKSVDPLFISATDLHIPVNSPVESQGITIAGLTVDFDGDARPATPDIGADEVMLPPSGTLQFSSATYSVTEGAPTVTLTVTRTGGSFGAASANFAFGGGSATGGAACGVGVDYVNAGGTVTFADGDAADKTFTVAVCDDNLFESAETFNATLSIASGTATLGTPNPSTVTINDNDLAPSLAFSALNYGIGEGASTAAITVARTGASENAVTVDYATSSGTATGGAVCGAGVDFVTAAGTLSFASGELSKSFNVVICDDSLYEADELLSLAISNPTGGAILGSPASSSLSINENDSAPTVQFSSGAYTSSDDLAARSLKADPLAPATTTITVNRSGATENAVTVDYAAGGGTATGGLSCTAGVDYVSTNGTLSFASGELTKSFNVSVCTDALFEGDETVQLTLSNASSPALIGGTNPAVLTITDNDAQPSLQFSSATYTNGDDIAKLGVTTDGFAPSVATISVTRTGAADNVVSVDYATGGGTATGSASCLPGSDYVTTAGTLNFAAGEISKDFSVTVCTDALFEGDETVNLTLSNPTAPAALGTPNSAVLTITDNDPQPMLQFSSNTYSVSESGPTVTVTVNRTGASDNLVTVGYLTNGGTATAGGGVCGTGQDYTSTSGLLTFGPGELSKTFTVAICDDAVAENPESFGVALQSPTGGAVLGAISTAVVVINDNDGADYIVTTTGNAIVVTDTKDSSDTMLVQQVAASTINFQVTGRTFQVDGGAILNSSSGNLPLTGVTSVTVNGQGGADGISVGAFGTLPSLTINGGTGNDVVNFTGGITFDAGSNLDVDLQNDDAAPGVDTINVNTGLTLAGSGTATFKASQSVNVSVGAIVVADGNLTIEANQQTTPTSGNFRGVTINTAGLTTTGTGNIVVKGKGGSAAVNFLRGILLSNGTIASTSTAAGAGKITLIGVGGSGLSQNRGVEIFGSVNAITSVVGDISITGTGGAGASSANVGVLVTGTAGVRSSGSAKVSITGTGGAGSNGQIGVRMINAGAEITSAGGDITINGFGGTAVSSSGNHGVSIAFGALVSATGGAKIDVNGMGGAGTGSTTGIIVALADLTATSTFAKVTSDSGNISLNGTGGTGVGGGNIGINVNGGAVVQGTGTANVSLTGTGGTGGDDNYGLDFESANVAGTTVSTATGTLTLSGTATSTSGLRQNGIRFEDSVGSSQFTITAGGNTAVTATTASTDPTSAALEFADDASIQMLGTDNVFNTDTMAVGTSQINIGSSNNLVIKPVTAARLIDLGGADSGTTLGLADSELDKISAGVLTIGGASTGNISVTANISRSAPTQFKIVTGADIGINTGSVTNAGGVTTFDPAGFLFVPNSGVDSAAFTTQIANGRTLRLGLGLPVADTGYQQYNVQGIVDINGVTLGLDMFSMPIGGEVYTLVANDGTDAVAGTFVGLPEGTVITNVVGSGLNATISYVGGTGNDVVLTVATPPSSIQFSSATASVSEANPSVSIAVTRTGSTVLPAAVSYSTFSGSATSGATCSAGVDFVNASGTLNFATGETSKNIVVAVCADNNIEADETFGVTLSNATGGATLGTPASATVTITNDDFDTTPPVVLAYAPLANIASIGNRTFTVTATDDIGVTGVEVNWENNGSTNTITNTCSPTGGTPQNGTWSCTILASAGTPVQSNPGSVTYSVRAIDAAANASTNPTGGQRNLFTVGSGGTINVTDINVFDNAVFGGGFTLNGNAAIGGILTLNGQLLTGPNKLVLTCGATVTNAGGQNYVIGTIEKQFCGPQAFSFPLGTPADGSFQGGAMQLAPLPEFTPVVVNVTSITVPASLVATVTDGSLPGSDPLQSASRYWDIQLVGGPLTADMTFQYLDQDVVGNETNYRVLRRTTATAVYPGGSVNAAANTATAPNVSAFSLWGVGNFVPTAANVDVAGAVKTANGAGIRNATVMLTGGSLAEPVYVRTNTFGKYRFSGLPAGQTYVVTVVASRFTFGQPSQVMTLDDSIEGLDFIADPQ